MNIGTSSRSILYLLLATCLLASCSTPKNVAYMQGMGNNEVIEIVAKESMAIKVRPYDKLSIIVTCKDPALAQMFNMPVYANNHVSRTSPNGVDFRNYNVSYSEGLTGYTVSEKGTIDFPVLGVIKIEGMTRSELCGFIKGEIMGRGLIKDPQVNVEFLNVGVSLIGEVNRPGRYDLNADVISLVDAIALAGDLTIQGKRTNVKVMRKNGDKIETYIVDLTDSKSLANSPAFYLAQGDIVYVEPNDVRKRQSTANGNNITNVSFWLSVASLLTSAAILFKK